MVKICFNLCNQSSCSFSSADFYGESNGTLKIGGPGTLNGLASLETRSVLHLSFSDSLFAYGPISDMAFSLTRNGVGGAMIIDDTGKVNTFYRNGPQLSLLRLLALSLQEGSLYSKYASNYSSKT